MSGKGSAPRPFSVSNQEYAERWDAIFGKGSQSANSEQPQDDKPEPEAKNNAQEEGA